jgi:hypothetical protein
MGGYNARTGHPVMIVVVVEMVVVTVQATVFRAEEVVVIWNLLAFIFKSHRNNEMIEWFAKYFFRFLCELTFISVLQTLETRFLSFI